MAVKNLLILIIHLVWFLTFESSWAGPLVWGPEVFLQKSLPPENSVVIFEMPNPSGEFWLQVLYDDHHQHKESGTLILLNGVIVVRAQDFSPHDAGFQKNVRLQVNNILEVQLNGLPGTSVTVQVRASDYEID